MTQTWRWHIDASAWMGILNASENFSSMEVKRLAPPAALVLLQLANQLSTLTLGMLSYYFRGRSEKVRKLAVTRLK